MKLQISRAQPDDAPHWAALRSLLWPDCPHARHELEIKSLLAGDGLVALARLGPEIVGMAEVSIRHDHVEGTSIAPVPYLEGWFVREEYRGRGIGRALVHYVEDWARSRGYSELASDAELHNGESICLHGTLGFREVGRSVHFVKNFGPPPQPEGGG